MASPSPPSIANPYQEGSLIFAMTTPPERTSKLAPRWKGPFRVYEDGEVQRTIHVNHTKPANLLPLIFQSQCQLLRLLVLLLDISQQVSSDLVLLLLHQSHLPGAPPPLPQQHQPPLSQLLPLRARCNCPQPHQPISGQNPLLIHGDLPDSTLSLAECALSKAPQKLTSPV